MLDAYQTIVECAKNGSTVTKVATLQSNDTPLLRKCLNYGLDPFKTYGIRQFEFRTCTKESPAWDLIFDCCDKLMRRELTGDAARNHITKVSGFLTNEQQEMFSWILNKDFRAGIAEGLVNKAFPKLIPEFEVQLAQPSKFLKKVVYPCIVQPKYDGVRTIALVEPKENSVKYYSRNGKEFSNFKCFDKELLQLANKEPKMFDGEVVGQNGDEFRGIMQQVRRKYDVEPKGLMFQVFDWMPTHHFTRQYATLLQQERSDYLFDLWYPNQDGGPKRVTIVEGIKVDNEKELMAYYDECVTKGYEGIIIKDIKGEYDFKRSAVWIKMKPSNTEEFKIIGIEEGDGKYKGMLGAIIIEKEDVKVRVGSGFKDHERLSLEDANNTLIGKTVEVEFDSVTPDGSLRFPRFKRMREDK
jgi:DNA ligase-1